MNITLEEDYQGLKLSSYLIKFMLESIYNNYPELDGKQLLFIDADGSGGFWERIGMKEARFYRNTGMNILHKGYEMDIDILSLRKYVETKLGPLNLNR